MPARPNVANVIKIVWAGTTGFYNWNVIQHCQWTGSAPSVAALSSFSTTLGALWGSVIKPNYYSSTVLQSVTMTDLTSSTANTGSANPNTAGTDTDAGTAANAAVLVNYPSSYRYRGGHPRAYWPAFGYNQLQDDTHWTSAAVTLMGTFITDIQNDMTTLTSGGTNLTGQCAVSYITAGAARTTPLVMPISNGSFTVEARMASQRRRIGRK